MSEYLGTFPPKIYADCDCGECGELRNLQIVASETTYFAADGNYGSAESLVVVNTSQFTEDDWLEIDECGDYERAALAAGIAARYGVTA